MHRPSPAMAGGAGVTPRVPRATYRLQLRAGFGFSQVRDLVPYLHSLGISDVYASPYLRARAGSTHGYDVVDPTSLNPELGSWQEYEAMVEALRRHGMGQVLDVVPNHMAINDSANAWWLDVLENGPSSIYARFFDVDWNPLTAGPGDQDKVVLPVLGDQYGRVLENGELSLSYQDGAFALHYYDLCLPLAPETYAPLLELRLGDVIAALGEEHPEALELQSIITALHHLPPRNALAPEQVEERNREKEVVKRRIARLWQEVPAVRRAVDEAMRTFNGVRGHPRSFDLLDGLLSQQAYRLAFWRVAAEEINYRRFFDINEMAALRVEDPVVFERTHELLLRLVGQGLVTGLRIDHIDGLWNPAGYLRRLQRACRAALDGEAWAVGDERTSGRADGGDEGEGGSPSRTPQALPSSPSPSSAPSAPSAPPLRPLIRSVRSSAPSAVYTVVEKILLGEEALNEDWPVHGTTGYEFLNLVNGLFVDPTGRDVLDHTYARFIGAGMRFADVANSTRKMVMLVALASEVGHLADQIKRLAAATRRYRDFTLTSLTFVLREIIAALSVYRTYIDPRTGRVSNWDAANVEAAVAEAKRRNPRTDPSVFDFVANTLLLRHLEEGPAGNGAALREEHLRFVGKFQQTTGPVMAKGVEDTAFYIYNRLVSLNEVGGEPDRFGVPLTSFHRANLQRSRRWPAAMLTTSTHDTKRSEDVRARINVLSELPREWRSMLARWSRLNAPHKTRILGRPVPDPNEEYLLYQTLLGAWPFDEGCRAEFTQRLLGFVTKALREAKVHTSWINVNEPHEEAVRRFVQAILDESRENAFLEEFEPFWRRVAHFGMLNSLSQTVIKLTAPGVPDVYQGNELWDFSLVDPDNRRPVDFDLRRRALDSLLGWEGSREELVGRLTARMQDGCIKLYVTHCALASRRAHTDLYAHGAYRPLRAMGPRRRHVCAFARTREGGDGAPGHPEQVVVVAPVLVASLMGGAEALPVGERVWANTWLALPWAAPGARFRDVFTGALVEAQPAGAGQPRGAALRLRDALTSFPVALLERVNDDEQAGGDHAW